jgi:flagella basal body P-ring formation protein FlgA
MEVTDMNGRPLSMTKKVKIMIALTILAWATQTLFHQWGFGQEISAAPAPAADTAVATESFVPQSTLSVGAGTLELRSGAMIYGAEIQLKQLCRWSNADATALAPIADLVIQRFDKGTTSRIVSLEEIRSTLTDAGVNLAWIRFAGATSCKVTRSDAAAPSRDPLQLWIDQKQPSMVSTVAPLMPSTQPVGDGTPPHTLRDRLLTDLSQRLNLPTDRLQVNFDPKDTNLLNLSEPNFHFDVRPAMVRDLGDVSWDVSVMTDGGGQQKVHVAAQARAWQNEMTLAQPVAYRGVFRNEDLAQRRVLIDRLGEDTVLDKSQIVGQEATRDLQTGMVMTARMVEAVPLAKTGQYITITLNQGSVRITTVARAMETGSYGQTIKVRNDETKDTFEVTLIGPQTATMGSTPQRE